MGNLREMERIIMLMGEKIVEFGRMISLWGRSDGRRDMGDLMLSIYLYFKF